MPRQPRIQFEGAVYHVRRVGIGEGGGRIFVDDEDHVTFLRTLGETCERSGCWVFAWVLMGNHYTWLSPPLAGTLSRACLGYRSPTPGASTCGIGRGGRLFGGELVVADEMSIIDD